MNTEQKEDGDGEITDAIRRTIEKVTGDTSLLEQWQASGTLSEKVMEAMETMEVTAVMLAGAQGGLDTSNEEMPALMDEGRQLALEEFCDESSGN